MTKLLSEVVMTKKVLLLLTIFMALVFQGPIAFGQEEVSDEEIVYEEDLYEDEFDVSVSDKNFFLNAFMTAGYIKSDIGIKYNPRNRADQINSKAEYDNSGNENTLSKLGLQFTYIINDDTQLYAQILAKGGEETAYDPQTDWAFIQKRLSDNFYIKAGRVRAPFGLFAETQEVNFTYHWSSLPDEVYANKIVNSVSGANIRYDGELGDFGLVSIELYGGSSEEVRNSDDNYRVDVKLEKLTGISLELNFSKLKLQANYVEALLSQQYIIPGQTEDEATETILAENPLIFDEDRVRAYHAGAYYDDDLIFASEYFYFNVQGDNNLEFNSSAYYVSLGYHISESFIPHLTYSEIEETYDRESVEQLTDPDSGAILKTKFDADQAVRWSTSRQRTVTFGMKYLLNSNSAIKFDYSRIHVPFAQTKIDYDVFDSTGTFDTTIDTSVAYTQNKGFFEERPDRDVNVYKLSYDVAY